VAHANGNRLIVAKINSVGIKFDSSKNLTTDRYCTSVQ